MFVRSTHMEILMPHGLKIKWIVKSDDESCVVKSDLVVAMPYSRNRDRNFIAAARYYTSKSHRQASGTTCRARWSARPRL